jgi:hypothetical protein
MRRAQLLRGRPGNRLKRESVEDKKTAEKSRGRGREGGLYGQGRGNPRPRCSEGTDGRGSARDLQGKQGEAEVVAANKMGSRRWNLRVPVVAGSRSTLQKIGLISRALIGGRTGRGLRRRCNLNLD